MSDSQRPAVQKVEAQTGSTVQDVTQVYIGQLVVGVARLPTDYAARIRNFLIAYLGTPGHPVPFGGRDDALAELDRWLDDPTVPYLLLTAPAGRGKSALLARWVTALRERRSDLRIAFVPVSIRFGTNLASVAFAALAVQLARAFGEEVHTDRHTPDEVWKDICARYLSSTPPGRLLVVLDGIDEAANWGPDAALFPLDPLPGLKVALSARQTVTYPTADAWKRAFGWDRFPPVRTLELERLSRAGVADVLCKMGFPLDRLGTRVDIVAELHRLSEGDPLLVRLYVDDLWERGEEVARLRPEDLRAIRPGYEGYFDRWWDDQRRLWGTEAPLRERSVREVLNLLSAALGPLTKDDILHLAHLGEVDLDSWTLEEALHQLARFVVQTGEEYIFGHPKLGDYFLGHLSTNEQRGLEARFLHWGEEVLEALRVQAISPADVPAYLVRYYRAHLGRAGAPLEAYCPLVEVQGWAEAWYRQEGSYSGYLGDVKAVWEQVIGENRRATAEGRIAPRLGTEIRCALIEASIHSLAGNIPPELLAALVEKRVWTPMAALAYARQMPDEEQRVRAVIGLASHLEERREQALQEALIIAKEMRDEHRRAEALSALMPHLPEELREQALATAMDCQDELCRALALAALAPYLTEDLREQALREALAAAIAVRDEHQRVEALVTLFPHLSECWRERALWEALTAAKKIKNKRRHAEALIRLVFQLVDLRRYEEAVTAVQRIRGELWRAIALAALAPHLSEESQEQLAWRGVAAVREIKDEGARVSALAILIPRLPEELREYALAVAREIRDEHWRAEALIALTPHLPEGVCEQALVVARGIRDELWRTLALAALIPYLKEGLREQALWEALAATWEMRNENALSRALARLAPYLQADLLRESLAGIQQIRDEEARARTLAGLAPRLAELRRYREALDAVKGIRDKHQRALALAVLAPHLTQDLQEQALWDALVAARGIRQESTRLQALTELAPSLPEEVLKEALAAVQEVNDEQARTIVLANLVPRLAELGRYKEALSIVKALPERMSFTCPRAEALAKLAPYLPESPLREALATARRIRNDFSRGQALAGLAPWMAKLGHCEEALNAVREVSQEYVRAEALAGLAPYLPRRLLQEALEAAQLVKNEHARAIALTGLLPRLAELGRYKEALSAARRIRFEHERALALAALVTYLPDILRQQALREALAAAKGAETNPTPTSALAILAPHLPESLMHEALAAAKKILWEEVRSKAIVRLAPYLPEDLLREALGAAREIQEEDARAEALAGLASHLPEDLLWEVLAAAREIKNEDARTKALVLLTPYLSEDLLQETLGLAKEISGKENRTIVMAKIVTRLIELGYHRKALAVARDVQGESERGETLARIVPRLSVFPLSALYPLWAETLPVLARRTRGDLLSDIRALEPIIYALGKEEAVMGTFYAIRDVGRWWP